MSVLGVPRVDFARVQGRIARLWDPYERNPHVLVSGTTGSGKSHLIRYGLLPMRRLSRVLIIDVKGDERDSLWRGCGTPVDELPAAFGSIIDDPAGGWFRLVVGRSDAKSQVRRALEQVADEGHCVVVIDESRSITDRERVGLPGLVERLILEGRSSGVTLILGAQSTAWAVPSLKDQPAVVFAGQMRSHDQARRLAGIMGHGPELAETIRRLPARSFVYADAWGDAPILGVTSPPAAPVAA